MWIEENVEIFLTMLSDIIVYKLNWLNEKIKIIDSSFNKEIRYDETISLPSNWDEHDFWEKWGKLDFIREKLNDCKIIQGI